MTTRRGVRIVERYQPQDVLDCIGAMEAAERQTAVLEICGDFLEKFGFQSIALGYLINPASAIDGQNFQVTNWPAEWYERWRDSDYIIHDPIVRYALRAQRPFTWRTAYEQGSAFGKSILDESRNFGFSEGLAIPIKAADGPPGVISIGAEKADVSPKELNCLKLVTWHAYTRLEGLAGLRASRKTCVLTRRETDVLQYAAAGKTNWEIAMILGISESTVREYAKSAMRKLGCMNRAHAVAIAIQRSLILP